MIWLEITLPYFLENTPMVFIREFWGGEVFSNMNKEGMKTVIWPKGGGVFSRKYSMNGLKLF